ncbi:hypothetical protein LR48_Vigan03g078100 [Vigna angularis]|uniref:Uncharacterized protein n=1 Tax=Phaseolus angularis TaxID=3914 RepID=A0A0L9U4S4_PHAAN|nr:hypothetical protein LR48_Vigan03g078100 [Vigna angularis]
MASGPSGPPIPPSRNSDKGKGKKTYVVKLMTRFNNEIGSTSQPTTPTSTSTGRSVPPPLVVPAFTPTPHQVTTSSPTSIGTSLPPPIQVPGLTPTPYQVPPYLQASLSHCSHKSLVDLCMLMKYFSRHIFVNQQENLWTKGLGGPISKTASVGVSTSSPLDPAEEERLRNRCWLEAAGGKYKGRVYGIGNVTSQDDCVDSYIQQTQASSTAQPQNSEEILNLKSQLQQYGQQLQNLEGFIGVLLPFLPPSAAAAAQQFLNLPNPQVQNDMPNIVQPEQQPPEQQPPHQQPPDEQPQDGNDYMHY